MCGIRLQEAGRPENRFRFNGKELQSKEFTDASGLDWYDYGARMYDTQIGRWTTIDPEGQKYIGFLLYNYAFNNPINVIDPNGKDAIFTIKRDKDGNISSIN